MANRVELLAPCGSYESFLGAVHAGADAVYLGGRQFGARAYAENFSEDELTGVIKKAHLCKIFIQRRAFKVGFIPPSLSRLDP